MKKWFDPSVFIFAALLATAVASLVVSTAPWKKDRYYFEVDLASNCAGQTQIFYDVGRGFNEGDSSAQPLRVANAPIRYRFTLPSGIIRELRFDPIDREGILTIANARIVNDRGHLVHAFPPAGFRAAKEVEVLRIDGNRVLFKTIPRAGDPILTLDLPSHLILPFGHRSFWTIVPPIWTYTFLFICVLAALVRMAASQWQTGRSSVGNWINLPLLAVAGLLATAAILPFASITPARRDFYFFDVDLTSNTAGRTQVFFDMGRGENESDSSQQDLGVHRSPVRYRYMLPTGEIQGLRFDPIDREGTMTIANAQIVDSSGRLVHAFSLTDFHIVQQVETLEIRGDRLLFKTTPGAGDPILKLDIPAPITLPCGFRQIAKANLLKWIGVFIAACLFAAAVQRFPDTRLTALRANARNHPIAVLALVGALAVVIQCRPVIFSGMSFVSPDNAAYLLYDGFPTLPGYESKGLEDAKNSDVGAMLYQHLYYPRLEREALFTNGEWPFWNRYNLTGIPLLGQGQSMFGDLLNLLPMAAGSAAWAWDVKFLIARWLYAFGLGFAVWRLTRHLGCASVVTATGIFIGFFTYRMNHPAVFGVCYAPWIIVAWTLLRDARCPRSIGIGLAALLVSNWQVFTSGTVKEAFMTLVCMNIAGGMLLLFAEGTRQNRLRKCGWVLVAAMTFVLLAAPWWLTFIDALRSSQTSYDFPAAMQLPRWQMIGMFEDLFYRQLLPDENHGFPSANILVFGGVAWMLAAALTGRRDRSALAVALAMLIPLSLVFRFVPEAWIVRSPFIANIHHIDNTFSCPLVILATILSGFGIRYCWEFAGQARWWQEAALTATIIGVLTGTYFVMTRWVVYSPFFNGYILSLALGLVALVWGVEVWPRQRHFGVLALALIGGLSVLLWRHGQYVRTEFDPYVFNPKVRADFTARSEAVEQVRALLKEPSRPTGLGYVLFSGFNEMLGWEGIYGVDALRNGYYDDLAIAAGAKKVRWWDSSQWSENDIVKLRPIQDLFNVRYYLAKHTPKPRPIAGLAYLGSYDLDLYESPTAWPRAFFTDRIATYTTLKEFVGMVQQGDGRPFAAVSADDLASTPTSCRLPSDLQQRTTLPAWDYALTSNTTTFAVNASGPGIIVLTESYYPADFTVELDGSPVPYFRVNHAFKGICVATAGTHLVKFSYRPHRFTIALVAASIGIALSMAGIAGFYIAEKRVASACQTKRLE
jgi:hypothetical protein